MKRSPSTGRPPPSTPSTPGHGWRRAACSRRAANGSRQRTRSIVRWPPIRRAPTPPCVPGCCITTVSATARPRWSVTGRRSPWILSITVPTTSWRSRCSERAGETRRWQPGAASCPWPKRSVTRPRSMARRPISGRRHAELPADDPQVTSGRELNAAHLRGDQLHRKRGGLVATRVGRADDRDGACRVLDDGRAGERQRNVLARPDGGAGDIEHLGILVQLAHDVHRDVGRRDREIELAEQHVRPRLERERAGNRGGGVRHRRLLLGRLQRDGASGWACRARGTRGTRIALEPRRARGPCGARVARRPGRAGRTRGTLAAGVALRTRNPCRALSPGIARRALGAGGSLRAGGARCSRSPLRARVALVPLWPLAARRTHRSWRTRRPDVSNRTHRAGWPRRASWRSRRARGARRARLSGRPGLTVRARRPVRTRLTILSVLSRGADEPEVLDVDLSLLLRSEE